MPDPIAQLESFTAPPAQLLPPAEVRRRGDRIRRRHTALITAGSVAVVALIAAPLVVVAQHQGQSEPEPAPAPSWVTTVPDTFDVTAVPAGSSVRFATGNSFLEDITPCSEVAFTTLEHGDLPAAESVRSAFAGQDFTASRQARTLAVYADDRTAARVLARLGARVEACPDDTTARAGYRWATVDSPTVGDESLVISQQVPFDQDLLTDLTLIEAVRVGNAVLLTSDHTSAGGQQAVDETAPALTRLSAPVVDQMCVFALDPC